MTYKVILVIEDTEEFKKLARETFNKLFSPLMFAYVSTYEEAVNVLTKGAFKTKLPVFGVISDLFFPSDIDFRKEILETLPFSSKDPIGEHTKTLNMPPENPAGLGVARWCHEHKMPFILVSDGDRHRGQLGILRDYMLNRQFLDYDWDPLPKILVRGGSEVSKHHGVVWLEALIAVMTKL